jgi:hypothetical protein
MLATEQFAHHVATVSSLIVRHAAAAGVSVHPWLSGGLYRSPKCLYVRAGHAEDAMRLGEC